MRPEFRKLHYIFAGVAFLVAFLTYLMTMQPTIPFWDCGEFAAAAIGLQIPHPPGAPLWTIVGRIAMLLPTFTDAAARYNLFSVLSSAGSILLLYLTLVHLIRMWRGYPQVMSDAIITFGGALVGALAYTFTDSFWFNALECEVYAFGSLFISLVPWLILIWHEHADEPHSERYLMLIAYVIGLSLGVHQLALLTMFPVFMIVYYRRRNTVTTSSWLGMVGMSVVAFAVTFLLILSKLVEWAGDGKVILSIGLLVALIGTIIYGQRKQKAAYAMAGWALMLVFLGYTTYTVVMVRASQNPPMNENAPASFKKLAGYINRDQYGTMSMSDLLLHRRSEDQRSSHAATWDNYTSDADFFWRYQTNFMFHRYLGWNFIGRQDDDMGAGVDPSKTWCLPFLLGLFGLWYHFKKDPKRALTLLGMFIIMGYLVDWYQNQQDPQPRERDYFYVGAFYVFAMWVGIGAVGIMELLKEQLEKRKSAASVGVLGGSLALLIVLVPINMCVGLTGMLMGHSFKQASKWGEYSRKNNYIPYEYAYNILQSCEPNAVLFTYGDNDTFPLWCIQDAYGIRRDVRIVQLQLAQMMWYVQQLRTDNDWGAKALKLTLFTDEKVHMSDDDAYRDMNWKPDPIAMPVSAQTAKWVTGDTNAQATLFNWKPKIQLPSDQLVLDIIRNNFDNRPIYYSVTVPENERAGLEGYLMYEGLVGRVTPFEQPPDRTGLDGAVQPGRYAALAFAPIKTPYANAHRGMLLNTYRDPSSNRSAMDDQYSLNFRFQYIRLANWYIGHRQLADARRSLDTMEARIPVARVPLDYPFASTISDLGEKSGDWQLARTYAAAGSAALRQAMKNPNFMEEDRYAKRIQPEYQLADLEMKAGEFDEAAKHFHNVQTQTPALSDLMKLKLEEIEARKLEYAKDYRGAYTKYLALLNVYQSSAGKDAESDIQDIQNHVTRDAELAGIPIP